MKVRFVSGRVRVRLDDLEVAALALGDTVTARVEWRGGGWVVVLDPAAIGVSGEGGTLMVGLHGRLTDLVDGGEEGVELPGPPRVNVEKDYGPQHA
ncbi:hypothetical protein DAETH_32340 [Deinococcus aetherius]|uniref:Uncharacterized protein n=1 Tax=Deinococcus aetherius TaxID=200252 RepID=A0ABM8AHN2_9DEIO|nr:hypothetical protein [Deinococcus aetherius]BDP43265.1 hypothetical protein DAETH_32340 [Deinococcus aetherius]